MTAHSQEIAEAADVRSFDNTDDAAAALDALFAEDEDDEEQPDPDTEADEVEDEGEELDDEQDDEPEIPAIEPPVSLTAEEKARFAQLPTEAQQFLNEVETRRNRDVQQVTTKAAEAQRTAEAAAANAAMEAQQLLNEVETRRNRDVQQVTTKAAEAQRTAEAAAANAAMEAQRATAEKYHQFVSSYAPQPPDPNLAYTNPQAFIAQQAQYQQQFAQHQEIVQRIDAMKAQADQHFMAQQHEWSRQQVAELMKVPEFADPAKRQTFIETLTNVGLELGFDREAMADASAAEILALKRVSEMKVKAEKYDALTSRKMQRVRDAKSTKPNTAQPIGAGKVRNRNETMQRVRASGSVDDAAAAILALG